eukprot:6186470-Pleurochrysis_carterae.AAC.1
MHKWMCCKQVQQREHDALWMLREPQHWPLGSANSWLMRMLLYSQAEVRQLRNELDVLRVSERELHRALTEADAALTARYFWHALTSAQPLEPLRVTEAQHAEALALLLDLYNWLLLEGPDYSRRAFWLEALPLALALLPAYGEMADVAVLTTAIWRPAICVAADGANSVERPLPSVRRELRRARDRVNQRLTCSGGLPPEGSPERLSRRSGRRHMHPDSTSSRVADGVAGRAADGVAGRVADGVADGDKEVETQAERQMAPRLSLPVLCASLAARACTEVATSRSRARQAAFPSSDPSSTPSGALSPTNPLSVLSPSSNFVSAWTRGSSHSSASSDGASSPMTCLKLVRPLGHTVRLRNDLSCSIEVSYLSDDDLAGEVGDEIAISLHPGAEALLCAGGDATVCMRLSFADEADADESAHSAAASVAAPSHTRVDASDGFCGSAASPPRFGSAPPAEMLLLLVGEAPDGVSQYGWACEESADEAEVEEAEGVEAEAAEAEPAEASA